MRVPKNILKNSNCKPHYLTLLVDLGLAKAGVLPLESLQQLLEHH
jgi:hypothetical protein